VRPSLAEWHINKQCSHDFFQALEAASGLALSPKWRARFQSGLIDIARVTADTGPMPLDLRASYLECKKIVTPEFLIAAFNAAGGVARGSWGANDKLDGPFYRFVRAAYVAIPLRLRPKTPDALCRRCREELRRQKQSFSPATKDSKIITGSVSQTA
jgi:hypothetical protein